MLLQPQSWHPDVYTDITRMLTLNTAQSQRNKEMHLCPMQFDIAERLINRFTMKGETVLDPFVGSGTVLVEAALDECERFYPVFQFVLWGGKSPTEAIAASRPIGVSATGNTPSIP